MFFLTRKRIKVQISSFLLTFLLNGLIIQTAEAEINYPLKQTAGSPLILKGSVDKKVFFKKAFSLDLYVDQECAEDKILTNVAKKIELKSHTNISRERILDLIQEWVEKNKDIKRFPILKQHMNEFENIMVDLNPGDQMSVIYIPSNGTYLTKNGLMLGHVSGEDFAKTFFSIWIGDYPLDTSIKSTLLARR